MNEGVTRVRIQGDKECAPNFGKEPLGETPTWKTNDMNVIMMNAGVTRVRTYGDKERVPNFGTDTPCGNANLEDYENEWH
jgi:hypothetical protein